jgi:hypothetical protein
MRIWSLCLFAFVAIPLAAKDWNFSLDRDGEVGLTIRAKAKESNWGKVGAEAVVLTLTVDGTYNQDVTLFLGETEHEYRVLLGPLKKGRHKLNYERNFRYSAPEARSFQANFRAEIIEDPAIAHAPFLHLRPECADTYSDLPLLSYYEWLETPQGRTLQFTVIFSNEDGGTPTDGLYARWGRVLDIEHVYRWRENGAEFQGREHKETPFRGKKIGQHPLLYTVTDNNNFSDTGESPLRVALWPIRADLSAAAREQVVDDHPWLYRVMAEEMTRERKIERSGDPRNFLYLEAKVRAATAAASFSSGSHHSDRNNPRFRIERDGWVRTAIPVEDKKVEEIAFLCHPPREAKANSSCVIETVRKAFFLDDDYRPGPNVFEWKGSATMLKPGQGAVLKP